VLDTVDQFDIVIRHAKGRVYAAIPRLSSYARGDIIGAALDALEAKKQEKLAEMEEFGTPALPALCAAGWLYDERPRAGYIGSFALKAAASSIPFLTQRPISPY
jgi:hypothetical protein